MDQHFRSWSCGNQVHRNRQAGLRSQPKCARYAVVPTKQVMSIIDISNINLINNLFEMNADLGPLPYIQFNTQARAWIVRGYHGLHCLVQKRSGANALAQESFQFSALASPSSIRHVMVSHKSCYASLFSECVIIVLAELTPWFVRSPCWWTFILCPPSGPSQQQFMGFA